jgi:acyl carrier protein
MRTEKTGTESRASGPSLRTEEEIERWLTKEIAERLTIDAAQVDPEVPLMDYGLDSFHALTMSGELGRRINREVSPDLLWDYPTIRAIASHFGASDDRRRSPASSHDVQAAL